MIKHTVSSGDTLSGIAQHYGIADWREIYDHPANAPFKADHPDPNLIHPDDIIMVPTFTPLERRMFSYKVQSIDDTIGVQKRLNEAGFDSGPEDDIFGPLTKAAVERFQQFCKDNAPSGDPFIIDSGPVDGIVGPLTKKAMMQYYG